MILLLLQTALAAGESADIEMVRPTFSPGSAPGIDSPLVSEAGEIRVGSLLQYTRDPLVLYAEEADQGAVVGRRQTLYLGISADLGRRTSARLVLPSAVQWGSENPERIGSPVGLGDITIGIRQQLFTAGPLLVGGHIDVGIPSGTRLSWLGEATPRFFGGGLIHVDLGRLHPMLAVSTTQRTEVDTGQDFTLGDEVNANLGLRYELWPDNFAFTAGLLSRTGTSSFLRAGAETASELVADLQFRTSEQVLWDVGVGKGLAQGVGTSEFRMFLGMTWTRPDKPEPTPQPVISMIEQTPPPEPIDIVILEEDPWEDGALARIEEKTIIIRDPIQFELNTERILPISIPTLRYVGSLMNDDWRIGHVVIEGHASEEGSFEYNYDLSIRRARSIFEELLRAGVHPDRISYRGMGEVIPKSQGEDEASLAENRRVEFHIVHQNSELDAAPDYRTVEQAPWDGKPVELITPLPEPPKTDDDDILDINQFLEEDGEDDGEDDTDSGSGEAPPTQGDSP
ncbi:MAG: outer membrane protein OmpA-like peptidoglycan-associated protein [Myxococcota bacterium]